MFNDARCLLARIRLTRFGLSSSVVKHYALFNVVSNKNSVIIR